VEAKHTHMSKGTRKGRRESRLGRNACFATCLTKGRSKLACIFDIPLSFCCIGSCKGCLRKGKRKLDFSSDSFFDHLPD
jgi:hypothetical protein